MIDSDLIRKQLLRSALPVLLLVLCAPWFLDTYTANILVRALFFAMLALTVDVLWGYTGYLTFGQSAFFGVGAYAAALVFSHLGFGPGYVVLGVLLAMLAALLIGAAPVLINFFFSAGTGIH